jgi:hypothetical protein
MDGWHTGQEQIGEGDHHAQHRRCVFTRRAITNFRSFGIPTWCGAIVRSIEKLNDLNVA